MERKRKGLNSHHAQFPVECLSPSSLLVSWVQTGYYHPSLESVKNGKKYIPGAVKLTKGEIIIFCPFVKTLGLAACL